MSGPSVGSDSAMERDLAVETVDLCKRFGDVAAIDGLNLAIPTGSVYGFIGPNGAGKSTTLRMLMGLVRRTSGQARVLGCDPSIRNPWLKQRIGYVPESSVVDRWMRVREAIAFCRTFYETWNDDLCDQLRARFKLPVDQKVGDLSRGMSAKLSLLLALSHEPQLLILDEPTSGLDPLAREEFLEGVLSTLCDGPRTVLFSSHTLNDVQRMADDIGILYQGRLLTQGATDELLRATRRLNILLTDGAAPNPSKPRPEGIVRELFDGRQWRLTVHGFSPAVVEQVRRHFPVEHLEVEKLGLEDIFKDFIRGQESLP